MVRHRGEGAAPTGFASLLALMRLPSGSLASLSLLLVLLGH